MAATQRSAPSAPQIAALVLAGAFAAAGALGAPPTATADNKTADQSELYPRAELLGSIPVSVVHTGAYLVFGLVGIILSWTSAQARLFLLVAGTIHSMVGLYGLAVVANSDATFVAANYVDQWLYLEVGLFVLLLGLLFSLPAWTSERPAPVR
jgi:hypothetical protein